MCYFQFILVMVELPWKKKICSVYIFILWGWLILIHIYMYLLVFSDSWKMLYGLICYPERWWFSTTFMITETHFFRIVSSDPSMVPIIKLFLCFWMNCSPQELWEWSSLLFQQEYFPGKNKRKKDGITMP